MSWQFQVRQTSDYIMNKTEFYADLNRDFNALMAGETSFLATLANTSALLYERLTDVNWAGFYLLEDDTLVLRPFQGKIACVCQDTRRARGVRHCGCPQSSAAYRGCSRV